MTRNSRRHVGLFILAACLAWGVITACSLAGQSPAISTPAPITAAPTNAAPILQPTLLPEASPTTQRSEAPSATPEDTPTPPPTRTATPGETPALPEATDFPDSQNYTWRPVVTDLIRPVGLVNAEDGSGRLFVIEQRGRIMIIRENTLAPEPFLDIRDRIEIRGSEQGLLGLAFHPLYEQNGFFFVNYTDLNGDTVIARYRVTEGNPDQADASSEERLLFIPQPYPNHNGGGMAFGPDGYLYLGLGDGGAANDPHGNAQSLQTYLGKILRLDVDEATGYTIPADNPFLGSDGLPEIWAYALRNPWRFSFDRLSSDLFIGDVGQNRWEEINYLPAGSPGGANFGWDYREGAHPFEGSVPAGLTVIEPVAEYDHSQGCSVTGGVVYRGRAMPDWGGVYFFGDYCSGRVWGLIHTPEDTWIQQVLYETDMSITSFGEDENGEIYLVDHSGGVYQLVPSER